MERLDFASVMAVLRRNIPDENFGNQADFLDSLFLDMGFSPQTAMEFDQGQVCRWINGLARLSPNIISFYQDSFNQRKLVSLREDTLLIVDNFNVTASEDQFLDVMLKYRCRILFTTRSRYENHISLEVGELNPDTLLELVGKFFPEAEKKQDEIKEIIALLHGHTFAVELAARLLANGLLKPKALLNKLEKEKAALDADDKIGTTKDGRNRKATYYEHIHSLFSFYKLAGREQEIMRCMTLIPANGISSRRFAAWMDQQNMNTINDLMEMGFIHPKNNREILLHPMIREVAVEELNSDQCLDYGLIQQVMGSACVVKGDAVQAQLHHRRAMAIFEMVFEDEPVLLEEKRKEIGQAAFASRQKNQKLLV